MGFAADLVMDVEDDLQWGIAGHHFSRILSEACVRIGMVSSPTPPPLPSKSPSPNLMVAQSAFKNVFDIAAQGMDDADSEDMRSTIENVSNLAEDSRSTIYLEDDSDSIELAKGLARDALSQPVQNESLQETLDEVFPLPEKDQGGDSSAEVCLMTRSALLQGLADGRLCSLLAEALADPPCQNNTDKVRNLTRDAVLQGLADGRLDSLLAEAAGRITPESKGLVPQPPASAPPASGLQNPARNKRILAGGSAEQVMQMVSDADRKAGSLQARITETEHQLKDRDMTMQKLTENIQFARADFEHLAVDLQWHQEQVVLAEDRYSKLNEDRRAVALKLDEMRLKGMKDEWPTDAKQSQTARSWTSTITGGEAPLAIESVFSGWNTERTQISAHALAIQELPASS